MIQSCYTLLFDRKSITKYLKCKFYPNKFHLHRQICSIEERKKNMVTIKDLINSPLLLALVCGGLLYITAFSVVYLLKARKRALEMGITPAYIAVGAAAGLRRYIAEAEGMEQSLENAKAVLAEVSELAADSELAKLILGMYEKILAGYSLKQLRLAADAIKAASLTNVI